MRVWFVNHYAHPPSEAGPTRHHSFARNLQQQGHDVLVIASDFDHFQLRRAGPAEGTKGDAVSVEGVPWVRVPTFAYRGNSVTRLLSMVDFARRLWPGRTLEDFDAPDVVVGSSPHPFAAEAAYRLARKLNAAFVLEVRDLWPETLVALGGFSRSHPLVVLFRRMALSLYRKADHVVTVLPASRDFISARVESGRGVTCIPNGVDLDSVPDSAPPDGDEFTVAYAGAFGLANDVGQIVAAAEQVEIRRPSARIRFALIGAGPEENRLKSLVRDRRITNVEFKAPVPKENIYGELARANAFVLCLRESPLYRWGVSLNKLYDYMAVGRPILFAGRVARNPVEAAAAGIVVPPADPGALADAILGLANMSFAARQEMSTRAREFVAAHHDQGKLADVYANVLYEVVSRNTI
jgi:glycosyltransferase involved in cell wall biosynthesis